MRVHVCLWQSLRCHSERPVSHLLASIEILEDRALLSGAPLFSPDVYNYSTPGVAAEVGTIQASDPDGDYHSFWISAGNDDGHFQIEDDGNGTSATIEP